MGISLVDTIRADILSARLRPGTKLTLKILSARYDCGASPVREALNCLASEGWVERIDRRGFFVSGISPDGFADILFNRCFMESEALRRSIALGGADWEERVLITHFRLSTLEKEIDTPGGPRPNLAWEGAHRIFHMALLSACGSKILLDACERLHDLNNRYRHFARTVPGVVRSLDTEHAALCDHVLARRPEEAVKALQDHYQRTGDAVLQAKLDSAPVFSNGPASSWATPSDNGACKG